MLVPVRNRPGSVVRSQRRCEICAPRSFDNVALPPRSSSGLALPMPAPTFSGPPLGVLSGLRLFMPSSLRAATGARATRSPVHPPCCSSTHLMPQRGQGPLALSPTPATGSPLPLPLTPASLPRSRPRCSRTSMILPFPMGSSSRPSLSLKTSFLLSHLCLPRSRHPFAVFRWSRDGGARGGVVSSPRLLAWRLTPTSVSPRFLFFFFPSGFSSG